MQTALLVIGGLGVLLLLVSFVAGEFLDGVLDSLGNDAISGMAVASFLGAFGFVGALVHGGTGSAMWSILAGLAAGLVVGAGTGYATKSLMKGGDEANVRTAGLVGLRGTVIEAVPADGFGQINVVASGHITRLNARSDEPLPTGTAITIEDVLSPTSVRVVRS